MNNSRRGGVEEADYCADRGAAYLFAGSEAADGTGCCFSVMADTRSRIISGRTGLSVSNAGPSFNNGTTPDKMRGRGGESRGYLCRTSDAASAGWDLLPLEKRHLLTAHTLSRPWLNGE